MEQVGDSAPFLLSLDVPVPRMGEQLVKVQKLLDVAVPKQVMEVPKIFVDDIPPRRLCRDPQMAEQLVEVPTPSPALVPVPRVEDQAADRASASPVFCRCGWVRLAADLWTYGGLLVEGGLLSHPVGPPHRGIPPGQGGIEILAASTLGDVAVVDVPVNMQHKFQQSLVLHSVHQQSGGCSSCYTETGLHSAFCAEDR